MLRSTTMFLALVLVLLAAGCVDQEKEEAGPSNTAEADFCQEHQIVESQCPFCNPELVESLGFCYGHDVPEAFCYQCNEALIPAFKAIGDWCGGHDRPESQCYICNPELDPAASEIEVPENELPVESFTRRQRPPSLNCANEDLIVRLESSDAAESAGLQFVKVERRPISQTIECGAQIVYDANRYARLSSLVPGVVAALHKEPGERVEAGDDLATITSAHLGSAKASFHLASTAVTLWEKNQAREADLLARGVATEKDFIEAEILLAQSLAALGDAEQVLLSLGLSSQQVQDVRRTKDTSSAYTVTAPMSGIIVDRFIAMGEVVEPAKPLFAVADISRMWALVDIPESDLRYVQTGQSLELHVDGLPGETVGGKITWVSTELDPKTRTLRVRAEIPNPDGRLLANMFAQAEVNLAHRPNALVVPESAVQWEGCCNIVFVRKSATVYQPRKVQLGIASGSVYEVLTGLKTGDDVVTEGSYLLKTEILKGSIGAGCCEVEPGT
jgi:membrane fusion protein, heavy metal efflux system